MVFDTVLHTVTFEALDEETSTILLFSLFLNCEVLSIMEDWMQFGYRRLLYVPIIDKH